MFWTLAENNIEQSRHQTLFNQMKEKENINKTFEKTWSSQSYLSWGVDYVRRMY